MRIERIWAEDAAEFAGLVWVYEAALAASERKPVAALRAMMVRPEYVFLVAAEDERVVGFAIAVALMGTDAALLEYIAVDAEWRGRGVGTALFAAVAERPEMAERFLLMEVDSDGEDSPERQERARRKAFYRRVGARELEGVQYRMPRVAEAAPPAMELMVCGRELPEGVEKERVRVWIEACYAQVYGVVAGDARIEQMMAGCGNCIRLV